MSFCFIKRNHVSIWNWWIQKYPLQKISPKNKGIFESIIDETLFNVGLGYVWLRVATIKPRNKQILALSISKERKAFVVAERFISKLVVVLVTSGFHRWRYIRYPPQACRFLKLQQQHHPSFEKSMVERTMHYIKDRTTESFDGYFPCRLENCKLTHVKNWLNLFIDY